MEEKKTSDNVTPRKRGRLRVGPGIVLALAISALIGARYVKTEIVPRLQPSSSPIVERHLVSSSYEGTSGPTPEVSFIINRAEKLLITRAQLARLKTLKSSWHEFYGSKMTDADQAADEAGKYLANARGRQRTPVAHIQDAAASVITLSGEISSARASYWGRAVSILTPEQRKMLQAERETAWTEKTRRNRQAE